MSDFRFIEPEVAGDLGEKGEVDYSTDPPRVLKLEFEFSVWLGDDLLEVTAFPCFIVTERLRAALETFGGTGYSFDDATISRADEFVEMYPERELPIFYWMKVHGMAGVDDAGLSIPRQGLVVSDGLLDVLRRFNIDHCLVRRRPFRLNDKRG